MEPEKFARPNGAEMPLPEVSPVAPPLKVAADIRRSATLGKLVESLAKAQAEFKPVLKEAENEGYKRNGKASKYATLDAAISATQPALSKHGLVVIALPDTMDCDKTVALTSLLIHTSDEWIESRLTMPSVQQFTNQTIGTAITYARRYSYLALIGVAPEDDDDGNTAAGVGNKNAAQEVARKQLEEKAQSPDPKIRQMAQDGLAAIRAKEQAKAPSLEGALKQSIAAVPKAHIPLEESLESAKNDGMFDEIGGVIQQVREMVTTPAKGSKPYRRIALAVVNKADGEMKDIELVSWDNLLLSDGKLWDYLENVTDSPAVFLCEVSEYKGKPSYTVRDVKAIGTHSWDARVGVIQQGAR